jgi:hypothetical protein
MPRERRLPAPRHSGRDLRGGRPLRGTMSPTSRIGEPSFSPTPRRTNPARDNGRHRLPAVHEPDVESGPGRGNGGRSVCQVESIAKPNRHPRENLPLSTGDQ